MYLRAGIAAAVLLAAVAPAHANRRALHMVCRAPTTGSRARAAVLALALLLPGCAATTKQTAPGAAPALIVPRGRVLVLGDSIMVGARDYGGLEQLLADTGWEPEVIAESSRTVAWALEQVQQRARIPRTVVLALGSNPGPGLGTFPDESAALIQALRERRARRILWIPPHHLETDRYAERVGALLAIENRRLDVVDWPEQLSAHPEWFQSDGLHLTAEGYQGLAMFIRDALAG